jgi:hypothetical protein
VLLAKRRHLAVQVMPVIEAQDLRALEVGRCRPRGSGERMIRRRDEIQPLPKQRLHGKLLAADRQRPEQHVELAPRKLQRLLVRYALPDVEP